MSDMGFIVNWRGRDNVQRRLPHRLYRLGANMRQIHFASICILFTLFLWPSRCAGSAQERLVVHGGKKLLCTVLFHDSLDVDCGTESYRAVFTAKIAIPNTSWREFSRLPPTLRLDFACFEKSHHTRASVHSLR